MVYVMITQWQTHWQNDQRTYYTVGLIHFDVNLIREKMHCIFIKISESSQDIEHAHFGYIYNISKRENKVYFKVNLQMEINNFSLLKKSLQEYQIPLQPGWYKTKDTFDVEELTKKIPPEHSQNKTDEDFNALYPPFLNNLNNPRDSADFEDKVFLLLKLLGINTIHKYSQSSQAGLPDGVFKIGNVIVIYDATLNNNIKNKREQIINYVNRLRDNNFKITDRESWSIENYFKQVWIITNGFEKISETLQDVDGIRVKQISILSLVDIYINRLKYIHREEELSKQLISIGESQQ